MYLGHRGNKSRRFFALTEDNNYPSFDFRGFMPSFQRTEDQLAEPSARVEKNRDERDNQADRTQRFGISSYGSTGVSMY